MTGKLTDTRTDEGSVTVEGHHVYLKERVQSSVALLVLNAEVLTESMTPCKAAKPSFTGKT